MIINGFDINPQNGEAGTYDIGICPTSVNEGLDKEIQVDAVCGDKNATLTLKHEGMRQPINLSGGGVFRIKGGGRFGVLKVGNPIYPPTPMETYTRLTHIECNGKQYIDLGYVVKEDDVIEANYVLKQIAAADTFLFGTSDGKTGLWFEYYNNTAYYRFGHTSSSSFNDSSNEYKVVLKKGNALIGSTSSSLGYVSMPTTSLVLFAGRTSNNTPYSYGNYRCSLFRITDSDGVVMELLPYRRDSDGAVGLLDSISGKFYTSASEPLIAGGVLTDGYELVEYVTFDGTVAFDTGVYGNNETYIDVLFKRTNTSAAHYLFGCSSGNRLTGYLTSSGYWRYGSGYPTFNTNNTNLTKAIVTPTKTTVGSTTRTFSTSAFTTAFTMPLGGHKPASGVATPSYKGYVYYFVMRHGNEIVVDWLPCKRLSDGAEGFWDCVTQTFVESL